MFFRGCCYFKKFHSTAVLLSVIFLLVTYLGCSANEGCNSLRGFDTNSQVVFDGHFSTGLALKSYVRQCSNETIELTAKDPYNSSIEYYPRDSGKMVLAPGDVVAIRLIYVPTHLGASSVTLVLRTSVSGFIIQTKGFAAESSYLFRPLCHVHIYSSAKWSKNLPIFYPSECGVSLAEEPIEAFLGPYGSKFLGGSSISPEVVRVEVSGPECGLNGLLVRNCKCFYVLPGEAVRFQLSDRAALYAATLEVDLELALAASAKKPNEISSQIYIFKKSMFWIRVRKVLLVLLTTALLYLLVCPLSLRLTIFRTEDFALRKNSFLTAVRALNSLNTSSNLVVSFATSSKMKVFVSGEEVLLLDSLGRCSDVYHKQTGLLLDTRPGSGLETTVLSKSSPVKKSFVQDAVSQNQEVSVGKEKGRKRRKKKSREVVGVGIAKVSSCQSTNSPPSLSPIASGNSVAQVPDRKYIKSTSSKTSSKADNHKMYLSAQEKPNLVRTVLGKFHSPILSSTPKLPLHVRAPGTKMQNKKTREIEEKTDLKEKFTYDIWGDHLFGPPPSYQLMVLSDTHVSFFVGDPWTLMKAFGYSL